MLKCFSKEAFVAKWLRCYEITVLKNDLRTNKITHEVVFKNKLLFKRFETENPIDLIFNIEQDTKSNYQFIVVTNFEKLIALHTETKKVLDIDMIQLPTHYSFFLPLIEE